MREQTITALDIGTSKISCFIAKVDVNSAEHTHRPPRPRVIGIGHQLSTGVTSGTVTDMEETETSIRTAVDAAERMAGGSPIHDVYVNISAGQPESHIITGEVDVAGHEISQIDIDRVLTAGQRSLMTEDRLIIHSRPIKFCIDGVAGVRNPLGMFGKKLGVDLHLSTVAISPLKNIQTCLNHCHLNLKAVVLSPYASALAVLVPDERELGAICIDIGGGLTSIAAFRNNELVFGDIIHVGGHHVTRDIARGLSVSVSRAERLKILYGECSSNRVPVRDQIDIERIGADGKEYGMTIPRSMLTAIISPRVEEILELVRNQIIKMDLADRVGRRIIFTGGSSQISGLEELAQKIFSISSGLAGSFHIRLGRPVSVDGLADATAGPGFSTCAGLLNYGATQPDEIHPRDTDHAHGGLFARFGAWMKDNF